MNITVVPTEGGRVEFEPPPNEGDGYKPGTVITLKAVPNSGFSLEHWKVESAVARENPLTLTVQSNVNIAAAFGKETAQKAEKPGNKPAATPETKFAERMAVCPPTAGAAPPPAPRATPSGWSGPFSLQVVGQIGGPVRAVAVDGKQAYVGVGSRLMALDVSDPASPKEINGTEAFEGQVQDIAVTGGFAYVAAAGAGLYVVSLANPTQPKVVGRYDTPGYSEGVAVAGRYAYVADGPGGLRVVDVGDPAKPAQVAVTYTMNYAFDVALAGKYAYMAAAGAGLLVADVSNPARPVEVGSLDTPGYAHAIAVSGATAYVADGWEGIQAVDVSNPAQPRGVGSYDTPGWAMDVTAAGSQLYVANALAGLRVLDVADRAAPRELGAYAAPGGDAQQLVVSGGVAYVADTIRGLQMVNVSAPAAPQRVGLYNPMGRARGVAVAGRYAYTASEVDGMRIIDLADPRRPREVAAFPTLADATNIDVAGSVAYVATITGRGGSSPVLLYAVDISDPLRPSAPLPQAQVGARGNPAFVGGPTTFPNQEKAEGATLAMVVQGMTLYAAAESGLLLVDLSQPLAPCVLGRLETDYHPVSKAPISNGVAVEGTVAYVAVKDGGLYTVDVSNPRDPRLLGIFEANPTDVVVRGGIAYVLEGSRLVVADVADPRRPQGISTLSLPVGQSIGGGWRPLALAGERLLIADGAAGLLVVDVSNPRAPRLAQQVRLPGIAWWVVVGEQHVYVAMGEGGLFILQRTTGSAAAASLTGGVTGVREVQAAGRPRPAPAPVAAARLSASRAPMETEAVRVPDPLSASPHTGIAPRILGAAQATGGTCVVTSTADSGAGSLRECVHAAPPGTTVTFDPQVFPPQRPAVIRLLRSGLGIKDNLTIDGSNAGVILDGMETRDSPGLNVYGNYTQIKGLQILNFPGGGIVISGSHNVIGGDRSRGSGPLGEGNLISGNPGGGIHFKFANDNRVIGNYIGTDVTGTKALGNGEDGVRVTASSGNIIGGPTAAERNVISGNRLSEIHLFVASRTLVLGNYIGVDAGGRNKLGETIHFTAWLESGSPANRLEGNVIAGQLGISDEGSSYNEIVGNFLSTDASGTVAFGGRTGVTVSLPFNRIGGTQPGEGNVINGEVRITSHSVVVVGNRIGTQATGARGFVEPNSKQGVRLHEGAQHNFIGGTTAAERNVINGGESSNGAMVLEQVADHNFIAGNYIGTDAQGNPLAEPKRARVWIETAAQNTIQGNLIAGSQDAGVWLAEGANSNRLRANRITGNQLGIRGQSGEGNVISGNSFTNNGPNASDSGRDNRWDDGVSGNYWSDYSGADANRDGTGDTPYPVLPNGLDRRPLMIPPE